MQESLLAPEGVEDTGAATPRAMGFRAAARFPTCSMRLAHAACKHNDAVCLPATVSSSPSTARCCHARQEIDARQTEECGIG